MYSTARSPSGHNMESFYPDDDEDTMYLRESACLADIFLKILAKWPDATMEQITIGTEHIHTECLGFDQYDAGDWTDFLVITRSIKG